MRLPQLRRVRWAVRATLALGVAASVTANILHAQPNPISQAIAAWPPLALLLTVELISRVPMHSRKLAFTRFAATATIAGIAAWVSYWHMVGVASRYGETGASPYLLPLSVDGLIVVASVCLVELAGRINLAEGRGAQGQATMEAQVPAGMPEPVSQAPTPEPVDLRRAVAEIADLMPGKATKKSTVDEPRRATGTTRATTTKAKAPSTRQRRPAAETAALAAAIEAVQPDATDADIARQLGISTSRLRTIRREMRELTPTS